MVTGGTGPAGSSEKEELSTLENNHNVVELRQKLESLSVTLKSRYLGLVVVPGGEVVKIEEEEN